MLDKITKYKIKKKEIEKVASLFNFSNKDKL